jgi:hypothetical protein
MPLPFLLAAELVGGGLSLANDLYHSYQASQHPEDPDIQAEKPGLLNYALDVGTGLTGVGLARGGLKAAEAASGIAKAGGKGLFGQAKAGYGSLAKSALFGPPAGMADNATADNLFLQMLRRQQTAAPDEAMQYGSRA